MKQFKYQDRIWKICEGVEPEIIKTVQTKTSGNTSLLQENKVRASFFFKTDCNKFPLLFVKQYKPGGWTDFLKYLFLPSKAKQEWKNLCRFQKKGIKCPVPVAFSKPRRFFKKESCYLVTKAVENAAVLNKYVEEKGGAFSEKAKTCSYLAERVAELHEKGVYYRDLHAGNILIMESGRESKEIFFTDLHRAFCLPFLPEFLRVNDVAKLCSSLSVSASFKTWFLRNYCKNEKSLRNFYRKAGALAEKIKQKHIRSRSKRCVKNSTVFEAKKGFLEKYYGRRELGYASTADFIDLHKKAVNSNSGNIVKKTEKSAITVHRNKNGLKVAVKANRYNLIKSFLIGSRSVKEWKAAQGLSVRGFNTPEALSVVEKRQGLFLFESFFLTRWVEGSMELNDYIKRTPLGYDQKRGFIISFALTLKRLHQKAIYHADLKSNNILVRVSMDRKQDFYFIDLDRVYFQKNLSEHQKINNLAQINASVSKIMTPKDRLRFFYYYMGKNLTKNQRKHYYNIILEISRKKVTEPYDIIFE